MDSPTQTTLAQAYLEYLFGNDQGYVVIATTRPPARPDTYNEQYFEWPARKNELVDYIDKVTPTHNVYYCINMFSVPRRKKQNAIPQNLVWADLDAAHPDRLEIPPQCVVESSPNRFQAVWRLDQKVDPVVAEDYSKRIAYHHANLGVDKGWATTKMLRVPGTYNFKYELDEAPVVELRGMVETLLPIDLFEALPPAQITDAEIENTPMPEDNEQATPEMILYRYRNRMIELGLSGTFARYYSEEPDNDWSRVLWKLMAVCFDAGMATEETFVIAKNSKCNKYERDNRPDSDLWRDVLKAYAQRDVDITILGGKIKALEFPKLLTSKETDLVTSTIIDDYMKWAVTATDAVPAYHELSCAVLLSAMMSSSLRLDVRNTKIVPNLWGMVLGDSTLTRKTTAMDMAMEFVLEIERDLMLGTDASAEGLMTALSLRPKQVSIFYRDEITGFFNAIQRKEYMASVPEIMTKLYDVPKFLSRRLRKDTYLVTEPIFVFFGGGIRDKLYSLVPDEFYLSGFMPRFLIVNGYADSVDVRPLGPPDERSDGANRMDLLNTFRSLYGIYSTRTITITAPDGSQSSLLPENEVLLSSAMWERAAEIEKTLIDTARLSIESDKALPAFSRIHVSLLKLTMLLAAAKQEPDNHTIVARMEDLINAASYIQKWGKDTVDLILNSGMASDESMIRAIYSTIESRPGIMRSDLMQKFRLDARKMTLYEETLAQRLLIDIVPRGRGRHYYPIGR
jgi:hypothetical protein